MLPSLMAPCPFHARVANAAAAAIVAIASHDALPRASIAAPPAMTSATIRTFQAVPTAGPPSSAATAAWSIGQNGDPAIAEAMRIKPTAESSNPSAALAVSQGRSAIASSRSLRRSP